MPPGTAGDSPAPVDGQAWHSRGYLPHFDQPGLLQMISFRLADSLPTSIAQTISTGTFTSAARRARFEALLDAGHGACFLREPWIARTLEATLLRFDPERYRLLAWAIMPNHVHVLIEMVAGHPVSTIVQSWKSYTAKVANRMLGRRGHFWQPEYFDRVIRDERHLMSAIDYIYNNPVKAGLVQKPGDWPFSSAHRTAQQPGAGGSPAVPRLPHRRRPVRRPHALHAA